jgi:predicted phosphodiesterase
MKVVEREFIVASRKDEFRLFMLGDVHIGALNCAERELRRLVKHIETTENAYWIGGGDYCDAVILKDAKRFDINTLPAWMLESDAETTREKLGDILHAQRARWNDITRPIWSKCLGMIEGNHEYTIFKHHNANHLQLMCDNMEVENLTDCAFMRLNFHYDATKSPSGSTRGSIVNAFLCHGHGGGRTSGAEPNKLHRLAADKDADIVLTGHTHSFCIHPPIPMLGIPRRGELPVDPIITEKHSANWGSFVYTYASGPSTYASRANYPLRAMYTVETVIQPHRNSGRNKPLANVEMRPYKL